MAHILIIDDDLSIQTLFKRFFEKKGYLVDVSNDGHDGLRKVAEKAPDLVITDIMMPDKDGLEVVLSMRKECPDLPVFAISGGMRMAPMDFLPLVKKFGARRVFYKPVELEDLLTAVEEELGS